MEVTFLQMFEKEKLSCEFFMQMIWGEMFLTLPGSPLYYHLPGSCGHQLSPGPSKACFATGSSSIKTVCGPLVISSWNRDRALWILRLSSLGVSFYFQTNWTLWRLLALPAACSGGSRVHHTFFPHLHAQLSCSAVWVALQQVLPGPDPESSNLQTLLHHLLPSQTSLLMFLPEPSSMQLQPGHCV